MKKLRIVGLCVVAVVGLFFLVIYLRYGGGSAAFPDRTGLPKFAGQSVEVAANLPLPPGNIAVSREGRVFISFHPEGHPEIKIAEIVDGRPVPFPDDAFQNHKAAPGFHAVLALRIDAKNRLWTLDNADNGIGVPRLLIFDIGTRKLVHRYDFPAAEAGFGSHLNDFQISPDSRTAYIADASIFKKAPALLVYDADTQKARRLLEKHPSVMPEDFVPVVSGMKQIKLGVFAIRPGVDSIALDKKGEWLYFAAVTAQKMYRIRASDLRNETLSPSDLALRVEAFADKTMSDGITMDREDNIYMSDPEHDAVVRLSPDRTMTTLLKDERFRWPDGFSYGPGGSLYFTCSALQYVILAGKSEIAKHAPYQIYRFKPGIDGVPGQ